MRGWFAVALLLGCACVSLNADPTPATPAPPADADDGFVPLFNGENLEGWEIKQQKGDDPQQWFVRDGILTAKPGWGMIGTTAEYENFILRLEWRVPESGNSGVFLRVSKDESKTPPAHVGTEVQILDDTAPKHAQLKPAQYSGSIYSLVPADPRPFNGPGQWNSYEITCKDGLISVIYNGQKTTEADAAKIPALAMRPRKGYIGLQNHESTVEYRNITIKVLD